MGGEFSYTQVDSNRYFVQLSLYRDVRGIQAVNSAKINVNPIGSGNPNFTVFLPKVSVNVISPACAPFSVELHTYADTVTISHTAFTLSYVECCRNNAITNLMPSADMLLYAQRNQIAQLSNPVNNSPIMMTPATLFAPVGQPVLLDFGAQDPDGDSLSYSIGSPMNGQFQPIPMAPGYAPIAGTTQLNATTGELIATASIPQVSVIRVDISEFRNTPQGMQLIGQTFRDIQVHFVQSNNQLPVISGMDSTQVDAVTVHPGDTVQFQVYASDADPMDTLVWQWQQDIPGAVITTSGGARPVLSFFWLPDTSDIQFAAHVQHLSVTDNNCLQVGTGARLFSIYVVPDTSEGVWPGDADYDGVAMIFDVLPIGLAYNETGPVRLNGSTAWVEQAASNWSGQFFTGLNHKHADANGDGVVDSADVDVVFLNYGQIHQKSGAQQGDDIRVYFVPGTLLPGQQGELLIEAAAPIADYFGMAMELALSPGLAVPGTYRWMPEEGIAGPTFATQQELSGGDGLAIATFDFTKSNRTATVLGKITFQVASGWLAGDSVEVAVQAGQLINAAGEQLTLQAGGSGATIDAVSGVGGAADQLRLYPNPVHMSLQLSWHHPVDIIRLIDVTGSVVGEWQVAGSSAISVPTAAIASGLYLVQWVGGTQSGVQPVIIAH